MHTDFSSIVAAIICVVFPILCIYLILKVLDLKKKLSKATDPKQFISDVLAEREEDYRHQRRMAEASERRMAEASEQYLDVIHNRPLGCIPDEELPGVIKEEVTKRVLKVRATGSETAHKLATACGGASMRVVDHCRRGHGVFKEFGNYEKKGE